MNPFLLISFAFALDLKTDSGFDIIENDKIRPEWSSADSKSYTCHPVGFVDGDSSLQNLIFNISSPSEIPTIVTLSVNSNSDSLEVSLGSAKETISSTSSKTIIVTYECKNSGWEKVTLSLTYDNETKTISWMKKCGQSSGFDWGLVFLLIVAVIVVFFAAYSARNLSFLDAHLTDNSDVLTTHHAVGFIVMGSLFLIGLFFFMKYIGVVLEVLVCIGGATAIINILEELKLESYWPRRITLPVFGTLPALSLIYAGVSLLIIILYELTKNWILNNLIGVCFAFIIIKTVKIPDFKVGGLLLGLAFFYDIFWVYFSSYLFGDNVMVAVAGGLDLPIKLLCPHIGKTSLPYSCSMLGLGDLALPGLFLAFASRFDHINSTKYLNVLIGCYALALVMCMSVLMIFNYPQPALLYISPFLIFGMLIYAYNKGQVQKIWKGITPAPLMTYEFALGDISSK